VNGLWVNPNERYHSTRQVEFPAILRQDLFKA
jgi:hypothetical protein